MELHLLLHWRLGMIQVRNDVCIEVCSEMNEWIDCIFLVSSADAEKAKAVLEKAFDEFWEQGDECYGGWLTARMKEANIEFEVFYAGGKGEDYDEE